VIAASLTAVSFTFLPHPSRGQVVSTVARPAGAIWFCFRPQEQVPATRSRGLVGAVAFLALGIRHLQGGGYPYRVPVLGRR
jgi:hypothetical protein